MRCPGFTFFMILIVIGCSTSTDSNRGNDLISVYIKNSDIYEFQTGIGGDEEGASIIRQANHFEISEIVRNVETKWEAVYKYKPASGFKGVDYAELQLSSGSDGASPPTKIEIIKFKFVIN